jgi:hypothetical protein
LDNCSHYSYLDTNIGISLVFHMAIVVAFLWATCSSAENIQIMSLKLVQSNTSQPTHLLPVWTGDGFVLLFISWQPDPPQKNGQRLSGKMFKFMCSLVIDYGSKKLGGKGNYLHVIQVFSLISRVFISWSCNFKWMSKIHIKSFPVLFTNLQKVFF